ncbi:MAG: exodeoxyribonuclease VII large subunit [bacterium]
MDDLFSSAAPPPPKQRKIYRVAEITRLIKTTLENEIGNVWIEGEISNFLLHSSGHMYFSLKDTEGLIKAAMFRGSQRGLTVQPANGITVRAYGRISAYPLRSEFQIIVERIEAVGKGTLQEQFDKLKEKLSKEGLFESARKKPLPLLPRHIGIVTSRTGDVIRDMLHILSRRYPNLHIVLVPVRVQGEGAAQDIAAAIDLLNRRGGIDVMIVGRGGGSLEDLWAFNEEVVARAIARSTIPVISAVGHEPDVTISDYVADVRAPTPSAAAELVVGRKEAFEETLHNAERSLVRALQTRALELRNRVTRAGTSYVFREPHNLLKHFLQRIDGLKMGLVNELRGAYIQRQQRTDALTQSLHHRMELSVQRCRQDVGRYASQLRALSPLAVLERGFSITSGSDGRILRDAADVRAGDAVETRLHQGSFTSTVTDQKKGEDHDRTRKK